MLRSTRYARLIRLFLRRGQTSCLVCRLLCCGCSACPRRRRLTSKAKWWLKVFLRIASFSPALYPTNNTSQGVPWLMYFWTHSTTMHIQPQRTHCGRAFQ
eukprot:Rmarinus@m.17428